MCVRLLHIRVQIFVTVPFFVFFQISLKSKKNTVSAKKKIRQRIKTNVIFYCMKVYKKAKITLFYSNNTI